MKDKSTWSAHRFSTAGRPPNCPSFFSERGGQRGCSAGAHSMSTHGGAPLFLVAHMSTIVMVCLSSRHPKHLHTERIVIAIATSWRDLLTNESRHHSRIALALNCKEHVELHLTVGREIHKMMNGPTLYIFGMTQDIISPSRVPRPCCQRARLMMTRELCSARDARTGWTSGTSKGQKLSLDQQPVKTHNFQVAVGELTHIKRLLRRLVHVSMANVPCSNSLFKVCRNNSQPLISACIAGSQKQKNVTCPPF